MVQYRPHTARAGRFSQRAQWGLHLGIEKKNNAWNIFDVHSKETVAARDVIFYERLILQTYLDNLAAERDLTDGFRGNRAFALPADEADWDEKNVDGAYEEAGPLPYCSVPVSMDDENPRESINAEVYYDFADNGYVTPQPVSASGPVAPPCSCRLLSHQTLVWHHRLGHPSLPRLRGMHSRLLVSGLPRSLPPLPPSPAPPCLPCVEGRQHAAPHSSSFSMMTAPLQTLHMDVWGPALRSNGEVPDFLIPWIRAVRLQLRERFREDLLVQRLHSDRSGVFSSNLLRDFCRGEGILKSFTIPASLQQIGIAERRISLVMEVARTSMIHAAAPHFLWPFAVRYAAHQLNLWPRVSLPDTSPTLGWTGKVGDASVFRDVTFDESVPFYHLFPYRTAPLTPLPLFLAPGPPPVDPLPPQGPTPSGVFQVDPLPGIVVVEVAVDSGAGSGAASGVAASGGVASGGAEPASAEPGGAAPKGAEPGGAEPGGAEPGGAESEGAASGGAEPGGVEPGGTEPEGAEPGGAESEGVESGGAEPRGTARA
ncbi:unnamed protein product [Closterium sp. NIES-53]